MPKRGKFQPITEQEAKAVVDVVLQYDPTGDEDCSFCQAPNRSSLDVIALSLESPASVVEASGLGKADDAKLCRLVEHHRWDHIISVFESLQNTNQFPNSGGSTLRFIDWTINEIYGVYKAETSPRERINCLRTMLLALTSRASMRGELVSSLKRKSTQADEIEIILTEDQKRKMLISEGQRLGLEFKGPIDEK